MDNRELERVQSYIKQMELKSRKDKYKFRRYYLMKYLRVGSGLSLCSIGAMFDKNHATIVNALKKVDILEGYPDYHSLTSDIAIEFPMDGLLANSKTFNGINIANSMKQLEKQLFYSKPSLMK